MGFRERAIKWNLFLLMAAALWLGLPSVSCASSSTRQQIQENEQQQQAIENERDANQENINSLKWQRSNLKKTLDELNAQLTQVSDNLASLERQISDKEQEIADTREALRLAREKEASQHDSMEKSLRYMYERGEPNILDVLVSSGSFSALLNAATYIQGILEYNDRMLDDFIENREFIESEQARLEVEDAQLQDLQQQARLEKERIDGLIEETSRKMSEYAGQISEAEEAAAAYERELQRLDEDLETLKKKLAEEIAMAQRAAAAAKRDISEVVFEEGDRYLLANLIYCEAGGEPYEGKLAVGAVVINRLLSSVYPDTVVGVIYQRNQFSPVRSGRLDLALANNRATESCYRAADEAMSGVTNVGGCVYFRTPIPGLTGIPIGGHIFY